MGLARRTLWGNAESEVAWGNGDVTRLTLSKLPDHRDHFSFARFSTKQNVPPFLPIRNGDGLKFKDSTGTERVASAHRRKEYDRGEAPPF